jgi:hypothetical protein
MALSHVDHFDEPLDDQGMTTMLLNLFDEVTATAITLEMLEKAGIAVWYLGTRDRKGWRWAEKASLGLVLRVEDVGLAEVHGPFETCAEAGADALKWLQATRNAA